ncbi:MAG: TAXI family TRAP transporter solute-binding subunit [Methyloligellaceae bacterium]
MSPVNTTRQVLYIFISGLCLVIAAIGLPATSQAQTSQPESNSIQVQPLPQLGQPNQAVKPKVIKPAPPKRPKQTTIGLISGPYGTASLQMSSELSQLIGENDFRVVPLIGDSQKQNLRDLFWLRGVDFAVVQSDTLNWSKQDKETKDLVSKLRYITEFSNSEVHFLAHRSVTDLKDLEGKTVNLGPRKSQASLTAQNILRALDITVKPVYQDFQKSIQQTRENKISATVLTSGKPAPVLSQIPGGPDLKLLNIGYSDIFAEAYTPTLLSHEDYPNLISENKSVDTLAVRTFLIVYNWRRSNPRYAKVSKFVSAVFAKLSTLQSEGYHPKWQEINPTSSIKGWQRFDAAVKILQKDFRDVSLANATAKTRSAFEKFLASQGVRTTNLLTPQEHERLFNQFMQMRKSTRP